MSRYDHKIETSLEGIEHLSKEKKEEKERKMKEKNHYYNPLINEVLKDKEKIEKGSRIIEKKPRNNLCYTMYRVLLVNTIHKRRERWREYLSQTIFLREVHILYTVTLLLSLLFKEEIIYCPLSTNIFL